jgi:hypothetical protein
MNFFAGENFEEVVKAVRQAKAMIAFDGKGDRG